MGKDQNLDQARSEEKIPSPQSLSLFFILLLAFSTSTRAKHPDRSQPEEIKRNSSVQQLIDLPAPAAKMPLTTTQRKLVTQFVQATNATKENAQRVRCASILFFSSSSFALSRFVLSCYPRPFPPLARPGRGTAGGSFLRLASPSLRPAGRFSLLPLRAGRKRWVSVRLG